MTTKIKWRRIDVVNIMDRVNEQAEYEDHYHDVAHELTHAIAVNVEIDALSRIEHYSYLAYPDLHRPMNDAIKWLREECDANGHSLCGMSLKGLLTIMSRIFVDGLVNALKHKRTMAEGNWLGDFAKFYDDSPRTPIAPPAPILDDYRIRLAAPEVEVALKNMVSRLVDFHEYDRDVAEGWIADVSEHAAAQLSADLPPVDEVGMNDWWNVALEWLSRTFALIWQREVRTLPHEP